MLFYILELSKKRFWTLLDMYKELRYSLFQNDQQKTRNVLKIGDSKSETSLKVLTGR